MRLLLDASAIAKRYRLEPGHAALERLLAEADSVVLAAHCRLEVASGLLRELHDAVLDAEQYARVMGAMAQDFADFEVLPVSPEIEALALAAMERSRLRPIDALHIATAQAARVDLFATADRRQAQAAQAAGLKTEWIEA